MEPDSSLQAECGKSIQSHAAGAFWLGWAKHIALDRKHICKQNNEISL